MEFIDYQIDKRLKDNPWLEQVLMEAIEWTRCNTHTNDNEKLTPLFKRFVEEHKVISATAFISNWQFNKHHDNVPKMMSLDKVDELLRGLATGKIVNDR